MQHAEKYMFDVVETHTTALIELNRVNVVEQSVAMR